MLRNNFRFHATRFIFVLSVFITLIFVDRAAFAQIIAGQNAVSNERPYIDQTHNGVPQINITTPNGAGTSHNIFTDFNVGPEGVIFNNSPINVDTTLGGWIEGNPNLVPGGEAGLILNEVIGGNISKLFGQMEIAGKSADLILANEAGIVCNACGFINTERATLTTGKPLFDVNGGLQNLQVQQGTVQIGAGGLNALNVERLDLIARAVQVYGELKGNRINVIAGANRVNYQTGEIIRIVGVGSEPAIAIDISQVGGMYANAIFMVATDLGVGVNIAGHMASANNIDIRANGQVRVTATGHMQANRNILTTATGPIILDGTVVSENEDVHLTSQEDFISVSGSLRGGRHIVLQSSGATLIAGAVEANEKLEIAAGGTISVSGTAKANDIIASSLSENIELSGTVEAVTALLLVADRNVDISGVASGLTVGIAAGGSMTVSGSIIAGESNALTAGQDLTISGSVLGTTTLLQAAQDLIVTGGLEGRTLAQLIAGRDIRVGTDGEITGHDISITATNGAASILGDASADNSLTITAHSEVAVGGLLTAETLDLVSGTSTTLLSSAKIEARSTFNIIAGTDLNIAGTASAQTISFLAGGTARFLGASEAKGRYQVSAENILISNTILANEISLNASQNIVNLSVISAGEFLQITAGGGIQNDNIMISGGSLALLAPEIINNSGLIWAQDSILIALDQDENNATRVVNFNGRIEAYTGNLLIRADSVSNEGTAPTVDVNGNIRTWYETGAAPDLDIPYEIREVLDPSVLNGDGSVRTEFLSAYLSLWEAILDGGPLPVDAQTVVRPSVLNADGSLKDIAAGVWNDMGSRAGVAGVSDVAGFMRDLLAADSFDPVTGEILPEFVEAYVQLWDLVIAGGTEISQDIIDLGIVKVSKYDATTHLIDGEYSNLWSELKDQSSASYTIKYTLYQDLFGDDGTLAKIVAGQSVDIRAIDVSNIYGTISAGDTIAVTAQTLTNKALGASQVLHEVHKRPNCFTCHEGKISYHDTFGGRIEANNAIALTVTSFDNVTVPSSDALSNLPGLGAAQLEIHDSRSSTSAQPTIGATQTTSEEAGSDSQVSTQAQLTALSSLSDTNSFATEVAQLQLFLHDTQEIISDIPNPEPETTPLFDVYSQYLTSQYMRDRLGYEDAQYDNLRYSDALSGLGSNIRIATNGIVSAALRADLAAPASIPIGSGGGFFAPGKLLSASSNKTYRGGALVSAGTINITATGGGDITNSGQIIANNTPEDGGALTIRAFGDSNISSSGKISGGDIVLATQSGNIDLVAQVDRSSGGQGYSGYMDRIRGDATLEATGTLDIISGGDLTIAGFDLSSAGNANIESAGELTVASLALQFDRSGDGLNTWQEQYDSNLDIGGDLFLKADTNLNVSASKIASAGDMTLEAGQAVNILAAEEYLTQQWSKSKKSFFSKKKTTTTIAKLTHEAAELNALGSLTITAGSDLTVAGSDLNAGDSIDLTAGDEVALISVVNSEYKKVVTKKCSFFCLFKSKTTTTTQLDTNQGSTADAFADLALASGGSTTLVASAIIAGGDLSINAGVGENARPDASVNILAATDTSLYEYQHEESSLFSFSGGTFWLYKEEEERQMERTDTNVASVVTGNNVDINAAQDINVTGSQINALNDLALHAGRDISVVTGAEGYDSEYFYSVSGLGISFDMTGSGFSLFAGYMETADEENFYGDYTAASLLQAGNDLTLEAGNNINQVGSDFSADQDVTITAGGDFNSLAAVETEVMERFHEELRIGVTAQVTVGALATANTIRNAINRFGTGRGRGDGITNAVALAQLAGTTLSYGAGIADAYASLDPLNGGGAGAIDQALGISASVSFGFSHSESSSYSETNTSRPSTIYAGNDLSITGEALAFEGTQAAALGDITLTATDGDILITGAQNTSTSTSSFDSQGASIGLGASFSLNSGFGEAGITVSANASTSDQSQSGTTYTNTQISSGGLLRILAHEDLGIEGGNLSGEQVEVEVGNDFWIASLQNISEVDGSSSGFNASLTFGPAGPTGGSLGVNGSQTDGNRNFTDTPSSLTSAGSLNITVGETTTVIGALINSDTGELSLDTGNLVVADLSDRDRYSRTGGGITIGTGGSFPVQSLNFDIQEDEIDGVTRGTIGLGEVSIRNLTPDEAVELIATFNRDPQAFQQILRERHFYATGELDVQAFLAIPQNLQKIAHAIAALATPVPDNVRAQGDYHVDYFRRLLAQGYSSERALTALQNDDVQEYIRQSANFDELAAQFGGHLFIPAELKLLVLKGLQVDMSEGAGSWRERVTLRSGCGVTIGDGPCDNAVVQAALNDFAQLLKVGEDGLAALADKNLLKQAMALLQGESGTLTPEAQATLSMAIDKIHACLKFLKKEQEKVTKSYSDVLRGISRGHVGQEQSLLTSNLTGYQGYLVAQESGADTSAYASEYNQYLAAQNQLEQWHAEVLADEEYRSVIEPYEEILSTEGARAAVGAGFLARQIDQYIPSNSRRAWATVGLVFDAAGGAGLVYGCVQTGGCSGGAGAVTAGVAGVAILDSAVANVRTLYDGLDHSTLVEQATYSTCIAAGASAGNCSIAAVSVAFLVPGMSDIYGLYRGAVRSVDDVVETAATLDNLPEGYRRLTIGGAGVNSTDGLPAGYARVVAPEGDIVIVGPRGNVLGDETTAWQERYSRPVYTDQQIGVVHLDGARTGSQAREMVEQALDGSNYRVDGLGTNGQLYVRGPDDGLYMAAIDGDGITALRNVDNTSSGYVPWSQVDGDGRIVHYSGPLNGCDHHCATNVSTVTGPVPGGPSYTERFENIFAGAGIDMNAAINRTIFPGHNSLPSRGHPVAYHDLVLKSLNRAVRGLDTGTVDYSRELNRALSNVARRVTTPGSDLWDAIRGR